MLNKSLPLAMLLAVSTSAGAAIIQQAGTDVTFTYDDSSLFGVGTVVGNSIFFSPTTFIAESANGAGAILTNETLNISIAANQNSGFVMGGVQMAEAGDYILNGATSTVSASGRLQAVSTTTTCGFLACNDSELFSAGTLSTTGVSTEWSASAAIDFDDTVGWNSDTSISAQIENNLVAVTSSNGELAFIQKKFLGVGLVVVSEVPVPAAAWLFASALLGLVGIKRKKA